MSGKPVHEPSETSAVRPISRRQFLLRNAVAAGSVFVGQEVLAEGEPRVTRHRLQMRGLRQPIRIVQLSDMHRSWCVSSAYLKRIVALANAEKPDAALLTGDFVTDSTRYMGSCLRALHGLHAPLGRFAVLGNHDYAADRRRGGPIVTEALQGVGIQVLTNASFRLENRLNIVGVDDSWLGRPDPAMAFARVHRGEPALIMTHNPLAFPLLGGYDAVTLAGHTHGGQINIPMLTRQLTYRKHPYLKGWFRAPDGPGRMYVSRGIGVVGIPIRLRCDPEISVFDVTPA